MRRALSLAALSPLVLLVACEFPTRSQHYTCSANDDCDDGRVCDRGYCVIASVDSGAGDAPHDSADANGVLPDAAQPADADMLAMICPGAGYTYNAAAGGYYRAFTNGASWTNAQAACKSHVAGATHLIVLSTAAEATYMASQLGWIGLSDRGAETQFVTVTGETGDARPWDSGQPDNGSGSEDCVQMKAGGRLDDDQCGNDHRFVCECDGRMSSP